MRRWIIERLGIVRLRQITEDLRHRLSFLPIALVVIAVLVSQLTLAVDDRLGTLDLPDPLQTSVDSSRPLLATIAGGLITTITLLLSMMLVAIQLASANFSPRTLRNWLGDTTLRWSIAIVLATAVFCLMALRSVRTAPDAVANPTITVLIAVLLTLVSLIAVIRAVDHVAGNMQVGTVANQLVASTIDTLEDSHRAFATTTGRTPGRGELGGDDGDELTAPADDARPVEALRAGFVQQIDEETLFEALPTGAEAWISVAPGDYVTKREPLIHVSSELSLDEVTDDGEGSDAPLDERLLRAFALGDTRTMQQDVGFGLAQLSDIAVRALSPGVNDPETASGIARSLGDVLRAIWSLDEVDATVERDGRTVHRHVATHEDLLRAALDPIRHHGRADPDVCATLARTVGRLRELVVRCELAGPTEPLDDFLADIATSADRSTWLDRQSDLLNRLTA